MDNLNIKVFNFPIYSFNLGIPPHHGLDPSDPMVRLAAGEYHAHSHTHLHLHSQQQQEAAYQLAREFVFKKKFFLNQ